MAVGAAVGTTVGSGVRIGAAVAAGTGVGSAVDSAVRVVEVIIGACPASLLASPQTTVASDAAIRSIVSRNFRSANDKVRSLAGC